MQLFKIVLRAGFGRPGAFLLLVLLCSGCGRLPHVTKSAQVHVKEFERVYRVRSKVSVYLKQLTNGLAGLCTRYSRNSPDNSIYLNVTRWEGLSHYGREQLIFHELGHCVLGFDHRNDVLPNDYEKSIMYGKFFGDQWYYEYFRDYYLRELTVPETVFND